MAFAYLVGTTSASCHCRRRRRLAAAPASRSLAALRTVFLVNLRGMHACTPPTTELRANRFSRTSRAVHVLEQGAGCVNGRAGRQPCSAVESLRLRTLWKLARPTWLAPTTTSTHTTTPGRAWRRPHASVAGTLGSLHLADPISRRYERAGDGPASGAFCSSS